MVALQYYCAADQGVLPRIRLIFELPASATNFRCAALKSAQAGSLRVHLSTRAREVQVRALAESTTRWCNRQHTSRHSQNQPKPKTANLSAHIDTTCF